MSRSSIKELRRGILEQTIGSHKLAWAAQEELERQGDLLRKSLAGGRRALRQTNATGQQIDRLIEEVQASPLRRALGRCCRCSCLSQCCADGDEAGGDNNEMSGVRGAPPRAAARHESREEDDEHEEDGLSTLAWSSRRLSETIAEAGRRDASGTSWRRTVAPSIEQLLEHRSFTVWRQQMDAGLNQIQHVAEEIGHMLDEQMKLADLLAIYLDYSVDRVLRANERLLVNRDKF